MPKLRPRRLEGTGPKTIIFSSLFQLFNLSLSFVPVEIQDRFNSARIYLHVYDHAHGVQLVG